MRTLFFASSTVYRFQTAGANACLYVHHLYETTFFIEPDEMNEESALRILREFIPEVEFKTVYTNGWEIEITEPETVLLIMAAERIERAAYGLPEAKAEED